MRAPVTRTEQHQTLSHNNIPIRCQLLCLAVSAFGSGRHKGLLLNKLT